MGVKSEQSHAEVIQRRINGSQDFYKTWQEYEYGFGNISHEFWIGNKFLPQLTSQENYKLTLKIDMETNGSIKAYADYTTFSVGSPETKYKLNIGIFSGTAGDSMVRHNGHRFSTYDQDNDIYSSNCAVMYKGGRWYDACHMANLNGKYYGGHHDSYADGVNWNTFKGYHESMKKVTMKIYY